MQYVYRMKVNSNSGLIFQIRQASAFIAVLWHAALLSLASPVVPEHTLSLPGDSWFSVSLHTIF